MIESNDRCSRGGDGEDPPHGKIEKSHALDHPKKRRKSQKPPKDSKLEIFRYLDDMKVDVS
jgi:hypothetical protein